jgi:hypothetical protein
VKILGAITVAAMGLFGAVLIGIALWADTLGTIDRIALTASLVSASISGAAAVLLLAGSKR